MNYFIYLLFTFNTIFSIYGQKLGLNPSSIKWKEIKTDKVQIVFPTGIEKQAQRLLT